MSDSAWVKKNLFVKTHQLEGLLAEFEKIMLLPKARRQLWLKDNEVFLSNLLDTLLNDGLLVLDGAELDTQGMELSFNFVLKLRETIGLVQAFMHEESQLHS